MKRKLMLLLACLFVGIGLVTAQTQKVTGVVISEEDGQPVIGASVLVKGTQIGAITNVDGDFTLLNVPSSAKTLQISYIGMQTQEVAIKPRVQVTLKSDSEMLDEVVVVAYGTASRQSITGAVASIDSKKLEMRPVTEVTGTLEGAAPGIQVNNSYGEPGSDKSEIRIRGFGSVNGTNAPLIVVDGSPYGGSLNDINPQDIESISVLKDASSAALYGNKAANGVIMITTKKGKSHKLNFRIGVKQGMYTRGIPEYEKLGVNQWMEAMRSGMQSYYQKNAGMPAEQAFEASKNVNSVVKSPIFDKSGADMFDENGKLVAKVKPGYNDLDWLDALERTGYRQEYTASADAMGDKYDVFSSFGYLNEKGYIIGSDYDRFTARLKANYQPTSWFKTGVSLSGTMSGSNYQATAYDQYYANPFYTAGQMAPVYPYMMHNEDGSIATDENGNSYDINNYRYLSGCNIIYEIQNDVNRKERNAVSGQVYGTISFLKDFAATVRGDLYNVNNTEKSFNNPYCGDGAANNGRLSKMHARTREYRFTQELTWGHDFDKHHIDVLLAHESFKHSYNYDFMMKEQMKVSDNIEMSNFAKMTSIDGYTQEYTTESYLSRARYNFAERYFMDASFRRDGSSRFYEPWGNFWSLGASWIISQEKFMKDLTWIDNLKFRVSYGEVGNDAGADYYAYKELFYSDVNAGIGAFYKIQIPNKNLKWETSGSLDIALEGRLFNRFNFSLDFFNKTSKDLLFTVYNPLSAGATNWYATSDETPTGMSQYFANIGSVRNTGLEVAMDVDAIRTKDWKWNIGLNLTTIHNEITKLPGGKDILHGTQNYSEGHSIYEFYTYTYAGVDQMTGRALYNANSQLSEGTVNALKARGDYVTINDKNYVYNTSYAEKDWQGSALPDVYGSINTALTWKDLTLSVLCTYSLGGKV